MDAAFKASLVGAGSRIAIWAFIGFLAAIGLDTTAITQVIENVGLTESSAVVGAIVLGVGNLGWYIKAKVSKGET